MTKTEHINPTIFQSRNRDSYRHPENEMSAVVTIQAIDMILVKFADFSVHIG